MTDEHSAIVKGISMEISFKYAIEISSFIRGKDLDKTKRLLNEVLEKKRAIPLKRFHKDRGHRRGNMAAGNYPINATKAFLVLLNSVEANAQNKGLDVSSLYISEVKANKASTPWHYGRLRGRKMKRTHVDIKVEERKSKKVPKKEEIKKVPKAEKKEVKNIPKPKEEKIISKEETKK